MYQITTTKRENEFRAEMLARRERDFRAEKIVSFMEGLASNGWLVLFVLIACALLASYGDILAHSF